MLKIGDFSRLSQVTVKTLHHYDQLGLLRPAHVDPFTSHRYYTLDQLPRIHRIMVLKELGLSLEQIAAMIDAETPAAQLREMLAHKEAEVQGQIDEELARLARIRFHIRQIDMEQQMTQPDIRVKKLEPFRALALRFVARNHLHFARVCAEIRVTAQAQGVRGNAHPIQITYTDEYQENDVDTEFAIPIDDSWTESVALANFGTLIVREFAGVDSATYLHTGNLANVRDAQVDLQRWIAAHGYKLGGSMRMVYLRGLIVPLPVEEWMFEIQHPLEKA